VTSAVAAFDIEVQSLSNEVAYAQDEVAAAQAAFTTAVNAANQDYIDAQDSLTRLQTA